MNGTLVPVVACLIAVGVLLASLHGDRPVIAAIAKIIASSAFVWAAIRWGALDSSYGMVLAGGLVCSWFGDAFLIPGGTSTSFRLGIVAFLLAHLAYTIAFSLLPLNTTALLVTAGICSFAGGAILHWLSAQLRRGIRIAVTAYVATIMLMTTFGIAAVAGGGPMVIAIGAIAFAISDLTVARDRFIKPAFINRLGGLPLYYVAQLLLAYSVTKPTA